MAGAAVGLLAGRAGGVRPLMVAGMTGALLPDLIDKPIGHLLLGGTLDNGRLLSHSLGFLVAVFAIGCLLSRRSHPLQGPVLALGVLSHQYLDAMWCDPTAWFYPFLGSFVPGQYPDYFLHGLISEISSPAEWIFGATLFALILLVYHPRGEGLGGLRPVAVRLETSFGVLTGLLGLLSLVAASLALPNPFGTITLAGDYLLLGTSALVEGVVILGGVPDDP